ncbi:MAG: ATPase [Halobacteriales archaeon]
MTTYLVAGARDVDAGKTTFSVGLLAHIGGTGFKPRASNDIWFHHDDYHRAIAEGGLHGTDARQLAAASAADVGPEAINPIHRLWRPAPEGDGFIGAAERAFVLDRVGDGFVVNASAEVPRSAVKRLSLADAPRIDGIDALNEQIRMRHLPHLRALASRVAERDRAVVESYGDIARPLREMTPDRVAVVEPGRARMYDGERYWRACEVAGGRAGLQTGRLEERVADVVAPIEPVATASLPPLGNEAQTDPDAVADAYAPAYEALVE